MACELCKAARQTIGRHRLIDIEQADDALRLRLEYVPGRVDGIAADVVEPAAANIGLVADVVRVGQEVGEDRLDSTHLSEASAADDLAHLLPLRMKAHHESLGDNQAAFLLSSLDLTRLIRIERNGLLAQHMLAGFK